MLDVTKLMKRLALDRPVFHSEADFQHALAWHIHQVRLDPRVRLEWPVKLPDAEKRIYVDLYLPGCEVAVELKYRTRKLEHEHEGDQFDLLDQSAQDTGRYGFLKDIQRLEQLTEQKVARAGFAVLLTNDPLYWEEPSSGWKKAIDAAFRIHEGRTITGKMAFAARAAPGGIKGFEDPICLKGTYTLRWREYSDPGDEAYRRFRYLAVQVGCPSALDEARKSC